MTVSVTVELASLVAVCCLFNLILRIPAATHAFPAPVTLSPSPGDNLHQRGCGAKHALSGLSATRIKHSLWDGRDGGRRGTAAAPSLGEQGRLSEREGGLFAADAGAGEESTETRRILTLRLNQKSLPLEMAGVFQ
jgi:hypothetical protein